MNKYYVFFGCVFSILVFASCSQTETGKGNDKKFLDLASIDSSVKPGDNFYLYVNGKWVNKTKIPP
ncbi:MAG TPA: hypothetical protein VII28_02040, partial [Puia sp.]